MGANPIVFGDMIKVYRKMPWGEGRTLLTSDSHWRIGGHGVFSPAYSRPAVMIGVSPLLIMDLDVHYGPVINTINYTYDSYDDSYDPMNLGDNNQEIGYSHQFTANLTLKAAVGPVAVLHMADVDYFISEDYYFNWEIAAIVKDGWTNRQKTFLLWEFKPDWRMYLNYEWFRYFPAEFQNQLVSTGLLVTNKLPFGSSIILQHGYHLQHPKFFGYKFWMAVFAEWDFPYES